MWRFAPLLFAASALGAPAAGHAAHAEAGLHSGKALAEVAQVQSHSLPRHVLRPGAEQLEKHEVKESLSTHVAGAGHALGALANSTADRWRLIASGKLPAVLPKEEATAPPTSTQQPAAAKGGDSNRSKTEVEHHQMQELSGNTIPNTPKTLWGYHVQSHSRDEHESDKKKSWPVDEYSGGGKDKYEEPREILGLPKIFWALVANVIAMACFIACIPFILSVAKRRRPISSS